MKSWVIILLLVASNAYSDEGADVVLTVDLSSNMVQGEYFGDLPMIQMWSDIAVRLSGDSPISIYEESPVYTSINSPSGAVIDDNNTNSVTFTGKAHGVLFASPFDNSNPFTPFSFSYDGSYDAFHFELVGLNQLYFNIRPFGMVLPLGSGNDETTLSYRIDIIPAPATTALLGIGGIGMMRRRR